MGLLDTVGKKIIIEPKEEDDFEIQPGDNIAYRVSSSEHCMFHKSKINFVYKDDGDELFFLENGEIYHIKDIDYFIYGRNDKVFGD